MQEAQSESPSRGGCCGKQAGHRTRRHGKCGSSHSREGNAQPGASALQILQERFARGEIDATEFEEKRRLIVSA